MKTLLIMVALVVASFATATTAIAAYSGGNSTCKGTIRITGTPQGNSWQIVCTGQCHVSTLGWGTCMLFQSGQAQLDHDNDPHTPDILVDTFTCGCRFENPIEPGYIYLLDEIPVVGNPNGAPACDAMGFMPVGQTPGPGGAVLGGMCGVLCPNHLDHCLSSEPLSQAIPDGQTVERTCICD